MVDGKAVFKTININKSTSQDDKPLVPGGKLLDLGIDVATWEPFFVLYWVSNFYRLTQFLAVRILTLDTNTFHNLSEHCACKSQCH
jgi:hypothetical protein